ELLLRLALGVLAALLAEIAAERALGGHRRDRLDGRRDVDEQRAEIVRARDAGQLLDQELRERGAPEIHGRDSSGLRLQVFGFRSSASGLRLQVFGFRSSGSAQQARPGTRGWRG